MRSLRSPCTMFPIVQQSWSLVNLEKVPIAGSARAECREGMEYRVKRTQKGENGKIEGLCGDGWTKTKAEVLILIKMVQFYVEEQAPRVLVVVRERDGEEYLTTEADITSKNNLANLPPC